MLTMQLLPADEGDAIWIQWGNSELPYQMLVDMGTKQTGQNLHNRMNALPQNKRIFELIVVTHVDCDHINGVLTGLVEPGNIPGLVIKDFWFNGFSHLNHSKTMSSLESMGAVQGNKLGDWLESKSWNRHFDYGPIYRPESGSLPTIELAGGLRLTILGPTLKRLRELLPTWRREWEQALRKLEKIDDDHQLESMGASQSLTLDNQKSLQRLADKHSLPDASPANGSSIAVLLEFEGSRILLAGDAFSPDLIEAINLISPDEPLELDAFKIPHHGSQRNVCKKLVEKVSCDLWLISTTGTRFRHPDDEAIARIICHSKKKPANIGFNVPSKINQRWDNDSWRTKFDYCTKYGNLEDGILISFGEASIPAT